MLSVRSHNGNPMLRCQGLIDFAKLAAPPNSMPPLEVAGDLAVMKLPGVEFHWNPSFADIALADGKLALAWGRARPARMSSTRGEAARWLERYALYADRMADEVGGGFAVLMLDFGGRTARLLVDRFSIETACYRWTEGRFGFSDSALDVPQATHDIDPQSLYDYLYFHVIPAPQTVFRDVRRVEPASRVTASTTACSTTTYWRPVFVEDDDSDLEGRIQQFVQIVEKCVEEEADEPATACFLSGGTDSSTVAGMLTKLRGKPVKAYSIGFEAEGYDEMEYARTAARHFGLEHHEYYLTPDDLVTAIPKVAASYDQPFGNSSVLPAYYCALKAKEAGLHASACGRRRRRAFRRKLPLRDAEGFPVLSLAPRRIAPDRARTGGHRVGNVSQGSRAQAGWRIRAPLERGHAGPSRYIQPPEPAR